MPSLLAEFVGILAAAILLYAGSSKLLPNPAIGHTLRALDVRGNLRVLASLLGLFEMIVAVSLLLFRSSISTVLLIGLASMFAGAGIYSQARGLNVPCACFGDIAESNLGWTQLAVFPAWLLVAGLPSISSLNYSLVGTEHRVFTLTLAASLAVFVALWHLTPQWTNVVAQRVKVANSR